MGKGLIRKDIIWLIVAMVNFIFLGKALWVLRNRKQLFPEQLWLEFSLFTTLCFIISPYLHENHLVVLYLPLLSVWVLLEKIKTKRYFALFIIAYLLLGLKYSLNRFPLFHSGLPTIFTGLKLAGCFVLYFLIEKIHYRLKFI